MLLLIGRWQVLRNASTSPNARASWLLPLILASRTLGAFVPSLARYVGEWRNSLHRHDSGVTYMQRAQMQLPEPVEWEGFDSCKVPEFLSKFWQRRPLLIRKAVDPELAVVGAAELLGLACDDTVSSRLVEHDSHSGEWRVRQGPFDEEDFMGEGSRWTVLVSEVDRHVAEVGELLETFSFLPTWRLDDIMVSYAPKGGGVGPHVDNYDVFLLQGRGKRRWAIENRLVSKEEEVSRLVEGSAVRVLRDFKEDAAWVLEPGDILYLPCRVPHDGVSLDNQCMSYSIGLRAPSQRDLVTALAEAMVAQLDGEGCVLMCIEVKLNSQSLAEAIDRPRMARDVCSKFYSDADLAVQENRGELLKTSVEQLKELAMDAMNGVLRDEEQLVTWLGMHVTAPRRPRLDDTYPRPLWAVGEGEGDDAFVPPSEWASGADVIKSIRRGNDVTLYRAEGLKFVFTELSDGAFLLFIDGRARRLEGHGMGDLCKLVTNAASVTADKMKAILEGLDIKSAAAAEVIVGRLLDEGYLYPVREGVF